MFSVGTQGQFKKTKNKFYNTENRKTIQWNKELPYAIL